MDYGLRLRPPLLPPGGCRPQTPRGGCYGLRIARVTDCAIGLTDHSKPGGHLQLPRLVDIPPRRNLAPRPAAAAMADSAPGTPPGGPAPSVKGPDATSSVASELAPFVEQVAVRETTVNKLLDMVTAGLSITAGSLTYLNNRYATPAQQQEFAEKLFLAVPCDGTVTYSWSKLPEVQSDAQSLTPANIVHPACFAFTGEELSVKPAPDLSTSLRLADEILRDGFVTSGEPILVTQPASLRNGSIRCPWTHVGDMIPQCLGYLKGQARMTTVLAIVSMCMDKEIDLMESCPKLVQTLQRVHVQSIVHATPSEAMFFNFKMSVRGSIRKPPNVITWVLCLQKLKVLDAGATIRAWNQSSSKGSLLMGSKAAAVKLVLDQMPKESLHAVQQHVGRMTSYESSAVSDDVLGNKRLYPGHHFKSASKGWENRGKVTETSFKVMVCFMIKSFEATPATIRTKPNKAKWEEARY